jgi:hypothetical protein
MPEHLIRLRGGWLWLDPQAGPDPPGSGRRVTLPLTWPSLADPPGRVRLVRSFGPPPFDPARERLALRLERVGGLASAQLNGREIARPAPGTTALEIPLTGPLPRRNLLVLDVDPPGAGPTAGPWGVVALVIGPRGASPAAPPGPDPEDRPHDLDRGDRDDLLGGSAPRA